MKCYIIGTGPSEITGKNSIDLKWTKNQVLHKIIYIREVKSIKPLALWKLNVVEAALYPAHS